MWGANIALPQNNYVEGVADRRVRKARSPVGAMMPRVTASDVAAEGRAPLQDDKIHMPGHKAMGCM